MSGYDIIYTENSDLNLKEKRNSTKRYINEMFDIKKELHLTDSNI